MEIHLTSFLRLFHFTKKRHKKNNPVVFSNEKTGQLIQQMNALMELKKPFLQTGYNIKGLADELKIPSYRLSALLNRELQKNFNDYLNEYRIHYCKDLIAQGMADSLNLKGISRKCGFNNRNSFTVAFKKFTGFTPSEFLKNQPVHTIL